MSSTSGGSSVAKHENLKMSRDLKSVAYNPLSGGGGAGGGCCNPPFRIFPRTIFAFLLRLPYGQFTYPLSRYPCIYEKIFQKFLPWEKLGVGGCNNPPRPEREEVAAKINKFS